MREMQVGIAHIQEAPDLYLVAAVTWFCYQPDFSTHGMTLPYMKKNLLSVVVVPGETLPKAINTAANRTLEKLLIKRKLTPQSPPQVELIVKPSLRNERFILPHRHQTQHWLLNAANRALDAWLRGER